MKRKNYLGLLFLLLTLSLTMQAGETYNVKKYGAKGNGRKMDSPAIQKKQLGFFAVTIGFV